MRSKRVQEGSATSEFPLAPVDGGALGKQQEWIALDKGLRNAGNPPPSAFKIPDIGEEVQLVDLPTSITQEQFWWVMEQWVGEGESYIRSVWRTRELALEDLLHEDRQWALKFRPPMPRADDAAPERHSGSSVVVAKEASAARSASVSAPLLHLPGAGILRHAWHAMEGFRCQMKGCQMKGCGS